MVSLACRGRGTWVSHAYHGRGMWLATPAVGVAAETRLEAALPLRVVCRRCHSASSEESLKNQPEW